MAHRRGARAVFLDRDGVINDVVFRDGKPASPRTVEEFRFCEGIIEALEQLAEAGLRLFVVTNQPDVARGLLAPSVLEDITNLILASLPVERLLLCTHDDADGCACRKPRPGMLHRVASSEGIDLSQSFIIGDSWKDVRAGRNAGCTTILLRREYNQDVVADHLLENVSKAADLILGEIKDGDSQPIVCKHISRRGQGNCCATFDRCYCRDR